MADIKIRRSTRSTSGFLATHSVTGPTPNLNTDKIANFLRAQAEKKKRIEDATYVAKNAGKFKTDVNDFYVKSVTEAERGAPLFTEGQMAGFEEMKKTYLKEAPSPEAALMLEERIEAYRPSYFNRASTFETQAFAEKTKNDLQASINTAANTVYQNPQQFQTALVEMNQDLANLDGVLPKETISELRADNETVLSTSFLNSFVDNDPKQAIELIKSGKFDDKIAPSVLRKMLATAVQETKTRNRIEENRFANALQDNLATVAKHGHDGLGVTQADFDAVFMDKETATIQYENYKRKLGSAAASFQTTNVLQENPQALLRDDVWEAVKSRTLSQAPAADRYRIEEQLDGARSSMQAQFIKNPAEGAIRMSSSLAKDYEAYATNPSKETFTNYAEHVVNQLDGLLPPSMIKILPSGEAAAWGNKLATANPEEIQGMASELSDMFDKNIYINGENKNLGQMVFNEIQAESKIPTDTLIAMQLVGKPGFDLAIAASQQNVNELKTSVGLDSVDAKNAANSMISRVDEIVTTMTGGSTVGSNTKMMAAYRDLTEKMFYTMMQQKKGSMSAEDVADYVVDHTFGDLFYLGENNTYLIPREYGGIPLNPDSIEDNISYMPSKLVQEINITDKGVTIWHPSGRRIPVSMNLDLIPSMQTQSGMLTISDSDKDRLEVFKAAVEEGAEWRTAPDMSGLQLYITNSTGGLPEPVYTEEGIYTIGWDTLNNTDLKTEYEGKLNARGRREK